MSSPGRLITPTEGLTGQPHSIFIDRDDLHKNGASHHPEHPRYRQEMGVPRVAYENMAMDAIGIGVALRYSLVEWVPDEYHMDGQPRGYHTHYWGPYIADDPVSQFITTSANLSGIRSRTAIDLHPGGKIERRLKNREHAFLTDPRRSHVEGNIPLVRERTRRIIGHSIINYALQNLLAEVLDEPRIKRFMDAKNHPAKTRRAAGQIIDLVVLRAIDSQWMPVYREAVSEGMAPQRGWPNPSDAITDLLPEQEYYLHYDQLRQSIVQLGQDRGTRQAEAA